MDHKISISQGGKPTAISNLHLLCKLCHYDKEEVRLLQQAEK